MLNRRHQVVLQRTVAPADEHGPVVYPFEDALIGGQYLSTFARYLCGHRPGYPDHRASLQFTVDLVTFKSYEPRNVRRPESGGVRSGSPPGRRWIGQEVEE